MGPKSDLAPSEKCPITELVKDKQTSEIIGRFHQTMKIFLESPTAVRKVFDKGRSRVVFRPSQSRIKKSCKKHVLQVENQPNASAKQLFPELLDAVF